MRLLLIIFFLVTLSCGDQNDKATNSTNELQSLKVDGTLRTKCFDFANERSRIREATSTPTHLILQTHTFSGVNCKPENQLFQHKIVIKNIKLSSEEEIKGWQRINFQISSVQLKISKNDIVSEYNTREYFGHNTWVVDQWREINGRKFTSGDRYREPKKNANHSMSLLIKENFIQRAEYKDNLALINDTDPYKYYKVK